MDQLITDQDSLAAASIRRQLAQIKEELVGEAPSVIEKLLGDQVVMTLLEVKHLEMLSAGTAGNISQAALLLRRLESAQREPQRFDPLVGRYAQLAQRSQSQSASTDFQC